MKVKIGESSLWSATKRIFDIDFECADGVWIDKKELMKQLESRQMFNGFGGCVLN